jgi:hypothetical protein
MVFPKADKPQPKSWKILKIAQRIKNDQRMLFSNPLVAFPSVGNIKHLEFVSEFERINK